MHTAGRGGTDGRAPGGTPLRRLARHLPLVAGTFAALAGLDRLGLRLAAPLWLFALVLVGVAVASTLAYSTWSGRQTPLRFELRTLTQAGGVSLASHLTGWGAALSLAQVFVLGDAIRHSGTGQARRALTCILAVVAASHGALVAGWLPTWLDLPTAHGLTAVSAVGLVAIGRRVVAAERGREVAEEEQARYEAELRHRAFHDDLTGLVNRERFRDVVDDTLAGEGPCAVAVLDLDGFRVVNDVHGQRIGDHVLQAVGRRLADAIGTAGTAARLGGDEFALLVTDFRGAAEARARVAATLNPVRSPIQVEGTTIHLTAQAGVAIGAPEADADTLLRDASLALVDGRQAPQRTRVQLFERRIHHEVMARRELERDLQRAVARDEFVLHYQPIVALATGEMVGAEALARWCHPHLGLVVPGDFIDHAERTGMIVDLGRLVLRNACQQAATWLDRYGEAAVPVSVNVSAAQLAGSIVSDVRRALHVAELPARMLGIELTESALVTDADGARRKLEQLARLGVRIALDDFGTGYSSLSYLRTFPFDVLKIDRSFLAGTATDPQADAVLGAILDLARALDLDTVAEGVETSEQHERLRELGCRYVQGHRFGAADAADRIEAVLAGGLTPSAAAPRSERR